MIGDVEQIRQLRQQSNAAIAARDADVVTSFMMQDITVAVAGGPVLNGRDASRKAFLEQFADRAFRGYVRTPDRIEVSTDAISATETGRWIGTWNTKAGEHRMLGTYTARWRRSEIGWLVQTEMYVSASRT